MGIALPILRRRRFTGPGLSLYTIGAYDPDVVADFAGIYSANEYYRTGGSASTFSDMFTYAGASNKTMTDSDGLLKWAPHNLITYSEDFSNAAWVSSNTPVLTHGQVDPDGGNTATKIEMDVNDGVYQFRGSLAGDYTVAFWVKGDTSGVISVSDASSAAFDVNVNVTTEWALVGTDSQTISGLFSPYIYRASGDVGTIYVAFAHVYRSDLGGMVNNPDRNDSYVPTTSSIVYLPRRNHYGWNGSTWVNKGLLLETESRTNLLTESSDFASGWLIDPAGSLTLISNNNPSPLGDVGHLYENDADNEFHRLFRGLATTAGAACTFSVFAKAASSNWVYLLAYDGSVTIYYGNFDLQNGTASGFGDLSIEPYGDGWYRCSVSFVSQGSNNFQIHFTEALNTGSNPPIFSGTGKGVYVAGAQVEQQPTSPYHAYTPSSYMPTTGSTFIRAPETLTIPAAKMAWPTPTVIGPELVTNGTFDTDTTGWANSSSVLSVVDQRLRVTSTSSASWAYQIISTEVGKVYKISADVSNVGGSNTQIWVGTAEGNASWLNASLGTSDQTYEGVFVAQGSSAYIQFVGNTASGQSTDWDNISVREIDPLSVSLQMQGEVTYADIDDYKPYFHRWYINTSIYIQAALDTTSTKTGMPRFFQNDTSYPVVNLDSIDAYSPGVLVPYNIASRHGSTFINGAVDGTAATEDTTPTALPDLSTTDFSLGYDYMGTIALFRQDNDDWADAGIVTATSKPVNIFTPVISGGIFVGSILTTTDGTWADSPTITYQWLRNGVAIAGATANTYTLVSADLGANISCRVTATLNGLSTDAISAAVGPISQVSSLFASGEDGAWYDPSDTTSLYQSRTGGDYADADGDVVGIMLDKSQMGGSTAAAFIAAQSNLTVGSTFVFNNVADSTDLGDGSFTIIGADPAESCTANLFVSIPLNVFYVVEFTINSISGDSVTLLTPQNTNVGQISSAGTYNFIMKSDGGTSPFRMIEWAGTLTDIDATVVIREIPGNHAIAPSDAARPLYKTDGTYHWLLPDATDDSMDFASAGMSVNSVVAYAVDAGASNVYLVFSRENAGNYIDLAANGSASACDNITGSPQKRLDGIPISLTTRDQVHDAFAGAPHVYLVSALDLSVWNNVTLFDYYTGGFPFGGKFFGWVSVDRDLTTTERDNLEAYLAAKSGVTL